MAREAPKRRGQLRALGFAGLIAGLLLAQPAQAQNTAPSAPAGPSPAPAAAPLDDLAPAQLDLVVNGDRKDATVMVYQGGDQLWVPVDDLLQAGVHLTGGTRRRIDNRDYLLVSSLRGASGKINERELTIELWLPPELLGHTVIDLAPSHRPEGLHVTRSTTGFLNYAIQENRPGGPSGALEGGLRMGPALITSTGSAQVGTPFQRGLTTAALDDEGHLRRYYLGDQNAPSLGSLSGGALLGGLGVQKDYSLDPYFIRSPLPSSRGFATSPSTLEVYVNGVLVRRESVAPGTYDLLNLPTGNGSGSYRTVLRDAFGRAQDLSGRFYFSSGLLLPGLSDYSYRAGFSRDNFGLRSFDYGAPVFLGYHRYGLLPWLTLGARGEAGAGATPFTSGGPVVTAALPVGELQLEGALSGGSHHQGAAGSLGWIFSSRGYSAGAQLRYQSDQYVNAGLPAFRDRARQQASVFGSMQLTDRLSTTLDYSAASMRDAGFQDRLELRTTANLSGRTALTASAARVRQPGQAATSGAGWEFYAGLTIFLEKQSNASFNATRTAEHHNLESVQAQYSPPAGEGFGYRLEADRSDQTAGGLGDVVYQGRYGRYEGLYQRLGDNDVGMVSAAGSVVFIGGSAFLSRPVDQGFALIRVPGVSHVRGFLNNVEIGRTDGNGDLLVPTLLPYYGNRVSVSATDLPIDYDLAKADQLVAPPLRGGVVASFAAHRIQTLEGKLVVESPAGRKIPAYGEIRVRVDQKEIPSAIGEAGEFYFENLPPGTHDARVEYVDGACSVEVPVPSSGSSLVSLGTLHCREAVAGR